MASWTDVVSDIRAVDEPDTVLATALSELADAPSTTSIVTQSLDMLGHELEVATVGQLVDHPEVEHILLHRMERDDRDIFLQAFPDAVRSWIRSRKTLASRKKKASAGGAEGGVDANRVPPGGPDLDVWLDRFGLNLRGAMMRFRSESGRVYVFPVQELADLARYPHVGLAEGLSRTALREAAVERLREEAEAASGRLGARAGFLAHRDDPTTPWLASRLEGLRRELASFPALSAAPPWAAPVEYPFNRVTFLPRPPRLEIDDAVRAMPVRIDLEMCMVHPGYGSSIGRMRAEHAAALGCAIDALCDPEGAARKAIEAWLAVPPWRHAINELEEEVARATLYQREPTGERIAFRMPAAGGVLPRVALQSPRRGGGFTAGRLATLVEARVKATVDSLEDEILDLLQALQSASGAHLGQRPLFQRLMDLLAQHPRVFLEGDTATPLRVLRAQPRLVVTGEGEMHRLEVWLGEHRLDASTGVGVGGMLLHVAPGSAVYLHGVLDAVSRAVVESTARTRNELPTEAVDAVCRVLGAHPGVQLALELPAVLRGAQVPPDNTPVVRLSLGGGGSLRVAVRVRPWPTSSLQVPGFGVTTVLGERDGERVFTERDFAGERARCAAVLAAVGLPPAGDDPWDGFIDDPDRACDALVALSELGEGAVVEWIGDRLNVAATGTTASMRIRIEKQRDWFGVEGGIEAGGETVPLKALLEAMRAGRRFVRLKRGGLLAIGRELRDRLARADDILVTEGGKLLVGVHAMEDLHALVDDEASQLIAAKEWLALRARWQAARTFEPALPSGLHAELRPYQAAGHAWLARLAACGAAACLADDMGLGKTVQALALLVERGALGPALVLAPTSVGPNWESESARFAPGLRVVVYRGHGRGAKLADLGPGDLVVTSYDILVRDAEALAGVQFATLVLDEAHALKNALSKRAQAARDLRGDFRVALTGTPLENHLGELWSLFRVLMPMLFGSWDRFRARFAAPIERDRDPERRAALAALVRPYLLRRTKDEVAPELPPRTEVVRHVELSTEERELYEAERSASIEALATPAPGQDKRFAVLAALLRLRQLASHPRLRFHDSSVPSSKLASAVELLEELRDAGHRALVFSQFTSHLALVAEALRARGFTFHELEGSTPQEVRAERVRRFQAGEGDVFLISLKAGGVGLNLTGADYVVHMDPWWNPAVEDQASDRAHRIGQDKPVTIVRLISRGTIEEKVLLLHEEKRELADAVLAGGDASGRLSTADLVHLMEVGEDAATPPESVVDTGEPADQN